MALKITSIQIQYKQNQQFEIDNKSQGLILPTCCPLSLANGIYTLLVPDYCCDGNDRLNNALMWSLYPQYSTYDFASGQV